MSNKKLKGMKRILHEDLIDAYWKAGIPRSYIYKKISSKLGYSFHCADLHAKSDFDLILNTVRDSLQELEIEFRDR